MKFCNGKAGDENICLEFTQFYENIFVPNTANADSGYRNIFLNTVLLMQQLMFRLAPELSTTAGSRRIQEKTWKTKDKLERHSEQGPSKNVGLTWEEVEASAQDRQTWRQRVALCVGDAG